MITLIGHGYIGKHIAKELDNQHVKYGWQHHTDIRNHTLVLQKPCLQQGFFLLDQYLLFCYNNDMLAIRSQQ